jgi:hypothetical protein
LESRGIKLPLADQSTTSPETRYEKGLEVQKSIFGEMIDKMYEESPANQIHIQKYLSANCFGDYTSVESILNDLKILNGCDRFYTTFAVDATLERD